MSAFVRLVGTVAGAVPFALAVGLDRAWGWGFGTGLWGLLVLIMVWANPKKDDDEGREFGA